MLNWCLDDETIDIIVEEGCLNSAIDFTVQFDTPPGEEPRYTVFDWHFDDGQMASGQQVNAYLHHR